MDQKKRPVSAKKGDIKFRSRPSTKYVLGCFGKLLVFDVIGVVLALVLFLIPFAKLIIAVVWGVVNVYSIVVLILYACNDTVMTTNGLYGRDVTGLAFDIPFERIIKLTQKGHSVTIKANLTKKNGRIYRKELVLHIENAEEFVRAYEQR